MAPVAVEVPGTPPASSNKEAKTCPVLVGKRKLEVYL